MKGKFDEMLLFNNGSFQFSFMRNYYSVNELMFLANMQLVLLGWQSHIKRGFSRTTFFMSGTGMNIWLKYLWVLVIQSPIGHRFCNLENSDHSLD